MRRRREGDAARTPALARASGCSGRGRFGRRQPGHRGFRDRRRHRAARDGRRVRLLQIDTPELGTGECYSRAARKALLRLVPERSAVGLEPDPTPRPGRPLRPSAAVPPARLDERQPRARSRRSRPRRTSTAATRAATRIGCWPPRRPRRPRRRGLWGACPGTVLDPFRQVETRQKDVNATARIGAAQRLRSVVPDGVHPAVSAGSRLLRRAAQATSRSSARDPHGFDGDRDGIGCET